MREKLREVLAKAVQDSSLYRDLGFSYQRGHELSGITHFELHPEGTFTLTANHPKRQTSHSFQGELSDRQRHQLIATILETQLLDVPSSSRNIGDDELPVQVTISYDDLAHQILIWAEDGQQNADFHHFEIALWHLFKELSEGAIINPTLGVS